LREDRVDPVKNISIGVKRNRGTLTFNALPLSQNSSTG